MPQPVQPVIPPTPDTGMPPAPPPEIFPVQGGSGLSPLRIAIIILAVLAIGGGIALVALPKTGQPAATPTPVPPTSAPIPTQSGDSGSLQMAISDDPAILEKELNDINLDGLNQEEEDINNELQNL